MGVLLQGYSQAWIFAIVGLTGTAFGAFLAWEYWKSRRPMPAKGRSIPRSTVPDAARLGGVEPRPNIGGRYHWKK